MPTQPSRRVQNPHMFIQNERNRAVNTMLRVLDRLQPTARNDTTPTRQLSEKPGTRRHYAAAPGSRRFRVAGIVEAGGQDGEQDRYRLALSRSTADRS